MKIILNACRGGINTSNKIPAIKAIREVSGYGLKEAKDLVDKLQDTGQATVDDWEPLNVPDLMLLKSHSITVKKYTIDLRTRTRQLLIAALKDNDCTLAKGLFQAWYESTND